MPLINVNDESAELTCWLLPDGATVHKNEPICVVETTKSAFDITAENDGILRHLAEIGKTYAVGHPIAFLAGSADEKAPDFQITKTKDSVVPPTAQPKWTKKAKILADRLGVDLVALAAIHQGVVIGEEIVRTAASGTIQSVRTADPVETLLPITPIGENMERVLILGGGGGASLVLDILSHTMNQQAIGILDNNPKIVGTSLMGVPILGNFDLAVTLWKEKRFDALISTVVRDIADRASIYERFTKLGIPFTNIIDPNASIHRGVLLGKGNLIIYGGYIATGVKLGDNNFLAAGTYIEHHATIGSHCTFGPRTSLSGGVLVEDRVKFGTQVAVEPFVEIGAGSVIASGVVLTSHVPAQSIVKNTASPIVRNIKERK